MQKIKIILVCIFMFIANNTCYAVCNEGEGDVNFYPEAFKGHAVFVWKESSSYSFAWRGDTNALISRKLVSNTPQISECIVINRIKMMKGFKQLMKLFLIKDPHSHNFTDINFNPMASRDDFLDLIRRLETLAEENEVRLLIEDSKSYESVQDGF